MEPELCWGSGICLQRSRFSMAGMSQRSSLKIDEVAPLSLILTWIALTRKMTAGGRLWKKLHPNLNFFTSVIKWVLTDG
ncbi:hypothetical protein NC651_037739 [Populus alba x Populus x berolinensis]|nr:hypothetical protein NC651_037739 [Populus alba x Populus x berolinensis]